MAFNASVNSKAIDLIKLSAEMTTAAESGHVTSAASLAHIVTVLMYNHLRFDRSRPDDANADRLVLSEGHACPIVYAAAADLGIAIGKDEGNRRPMTRKDALQLRALDSEIDGHPNPGEGFPFFPAATGSLGQGLSIAAGLGLAARLDSIPKRIYCIIGDGESREGQIFEAVDFLVDEKLVSVCPIFNCNIYGQSDRVSPQQSPEVMARKLTAAGFEVVTIDGHDPTAIQEAFDAHAMRCDAKSEQPFAVVAKTTKAWGLTGVIASTDHGKPISKEDLPKATELLDKVAGQVGAAWTEGDLSIRDMPQTTLSYAMAKKPPTFTESLKRFGQEKVIAKGKWAPRRAYGIAIQALGHANDAVVALDGDVKNSTFAQFFAQDPKLKKRYFECRIAEQHMISCGGGLCAGGKIPFVSTFGKFVSRGYDQLEMALISRFALNIVGSHVGISLAADGPSQMALSDVAFFHSWATAKNDDGTPASYVLNPADAFSAYALTVAMADSDSACYLRVFRPDTPFLYDDHVPFELGGHQVLEQGKDVLIAASGYMVHEAKKATAKLRDAGIEPTLIDMYSLPFDAEALLQSARDNGNRVVTVEDNFGGGMGSAFADAVAARGEAIRVQQMHVRKIPKSGREPDDLMRYTGLSADDIAATAKAMVK